MAEAVPVVNGCDAADSPLGAAVACNAALGVDRCYIDGDGDVVCSLLDCIDDGNSATVVQDYNATGFHDFSAWGTLHGVQWCCTIDDDPVVPVIDDVTIHGCDLPGETPSFQHPADVIPSADNLKPHRTAPLLGFIYGHDGSGVGGDRSETIWGSDYTGNGYRDNLYGEEGDDIIDGGGNGDWIDGGADNDTIRGSGGNDRAIGGPGIDHLSGEDGNDTLCDVDSPAGFHHMDGGDGNDTLWLTDVGAGNGWDGASTCGGGAAIQRYGDGVFGAPVGCGFVIPAEPIECMDPN